VSSRVLLDYLSLLWLPAPVQEKVAMGSIPLRNALILLDFTSEEAEFLGGLIDRLHLSAGTQREVFTLLWEISRREKISVVEFLRTPEFKELAEPGAEAGVKGKRVGEVLYQKLRRMKNPRFTQAEASFYEILAEHHCPASLSITPSPFFEKEAIHVEFDFKDETCWQKMVAILNALNSQGAVSKLLKIGKFQE
jgi:hypothetical protein